MGTGKHFLHDIRPFKANRQLLAGPVVPGSRIERPIGFQHCRGSKLKVALAVQAMLADVMNQRRRFFDDVPMNAIVIGNHCVDLHIR